MRWSRPATACCACRPTPWCRNCLAPTGPRPPAGATQARPLRGNPARRSRLRAAESRRSRGPVHVAGRALRAPLGDGDQQPGVQPVGPDLPRPDGHRRGDRPPGTPLGGARVRRTELSNRPVTAHVAGAVTTASTSWTAHRGRCCHGAADLPAPERLRSETEQGYGGDVPSVLSAVGVIVSPSRIPWATRCREGRGRPR